MNPHDFSPFPTGSRRWKYEAAKREREKLDRRTAAVFGALLADGIIQNSMAAYSVIRKALSNGER